MNTLKDVFFCPTCAGKLHRTPSSKVFFTCSRCQIPLIHKSNLGKYRLTKQNRELIKRLPFCTLAGMFSGKSIYMIEGLDGGWEFVSTGVKEGCTHALGVKERNILSLRQIAADVLARLIFGESA